MSGRALLAVAAALLLTGARGPDYPAMIRTLGDTVATRFYDPQLRGLDWPGIVRGYERRARQVRDDAGFARLAGEMMATLKASHSDVSPPAGAGGWATPALLVEDGVITTVARARAGAPSRLPAARRERARRRARLGRAAARARLRGGGAQRLRPARGLVLPAA
jgi:hypothetical protein